jgi:hypothetical protein
MASVTVMLGKTTESSTGTSSRFSMWFSITYGS